MSELDALRKIGEVIVPSGGQPTIEFSNIPQRYTHLMIRASLRSDTTTNNWPGLHMRFNGDAGANYHTENLTGSVSSASADDHANTTDFYLGSVASNTKPIGQAAATKIDINGYTSTVIGKGATYQNWNQDNTYVGSGTWMSTAALNDIQLFLDVGNFQYGSVASLYGLL